jgi:hypothetical protein
MINSGTFARGGNVQTKTTAAATSSDCRILARCSGVTGTERIGPLAGDRADVDDDPVLAVAHLREDGVGAVEDAVEVHAHEVVPSPRVEVLYRAVFDVRPGVVDENVDAAELLRDGLDEAADLGLVGHVAGVHANAFGGAQAVGGGLQLRLVAAGDRHRGPLREHRPCRRQPDAAAPACDEDRFAVQPPHGSLRRSSPNCPRRGIRVW